jgi:hypothetical protein
VPLVDPPPPCLRYFRSVCHRRCKCCFTGRIGNYGCFDRRHSCRTALWFTDPYLHLFVHQSPGTLTWPRRYPTVEPDTALSPRIRLAAPLMGHFVIQCAVVLILCSSNTCRPHHRRALTKRVSLE